MDGLERFVRWLGRGGSRLRRGERREPRWNRWHVPYVMRDGEAVCRSAQLSSAGRLEQGKCRGSLGISSRCAARKGSTTRIMQDKWSSISLAFSTCLRRRVGCYHALMLKHDSRCLI